MISCTNVRCAKSTLWPRSKTCIPTLRKNTLKSFIISWSIKINYCLALHLLVKKFLSGNAKCKSIINVTISSIGINVSIVTKAFPLVWISDTIRSLYTLKNWISHSISVVPSQDAVLGSLPLPRYKFTRVPNIHNHENLNKLKYVLFVRKLWIICLSTWKMFIAT